MTAELKRRLDALKEQETNRQAEEWREHILKQCERYDRTIVYDAGESFGDANGE